MKARVRQLRVKLKSTKKGNRSITEFVMRIKAIENSLLVVRDSIIEQYHINLILDDLSKDYNLFVM